MINATEQRTSQPADRTEVISGAAARENLVSPAEELLPEAFSDVRKASRTTECGACVYAGSVVVALILSVGACSDRDQDSATTVTEGQAGVRVVENTTPEQLRPWAHIDPTPAVEIGNDDGPGAYLFSSIGDAFETAEGAIVVSDSDTRQIHVFRSDGSHLAAFGGLGEGPGEFRGPPVLRGIEPATILAWDRRLQRLTWFDLDGRIVNDRAVREAGQSTVWDLHPSGVVIWQEIATRPASGHVSPTFVALGILDSRSGSASWINDLPGLPEVRAGETRVPAVFHPSVAPRNWVVRSSMPPTIIAATDPSGDCVLSVYSLDGSLQMVIRLPIPRRTIDDHMVAAAREWLLELGRGSTAPQAEFAAAVARMPIPDEAPAMSSVLAGYDGRVWVERWSGRWETQGLSIYDVIDRGGQWLGTVEIPKELGRILFIGEGSILLGSSAADLVPSVRRHTLRRDPNP